MLLAYSLYSVVLGLINNSIAETTVPYPVSEGFARLAGHFVDDAWGSMAGWNFFVYEGMLHSYFRVAAADSEAFLIPFGITALSTVLSYWSTNIPGHAIPLACLVSVRHAALPKLRSSQFLYALINVTAVIFYGEAEF